MENVILIQVESITDLEPDENFIILETTTGIVYRGNPDDPAKPVKMLDEKNSSFINHFLFMGG